MRSRDFCYWLQGFIELSPPPQDGSLFPAPTQKQWDQIRSHLGMVFRHEIDPSFGKDLPDLTGIHQGLKSGLVDPLLPGGGVKFNC